MEDNQKYQDIVTTARLLFWKFGIRRVSVEEICKEAGVSKMTYYRFFKNKIDVAKIVIDQIMDESMQKYNELMASEISFDEKIKAQVMLKFEGTKQISAEIINDIYSDWNAELKAYFDKIYFDIVTTIRNDYATAIEKGWIRRNVKLDFIFYMVQKMTEMLTDPALLAIYNNPQDMIMEFMNMMFYGILPRENES